MANSGVTQTLESLFGPPSDLIYISDFLGTAAILEPLPSMNARPDANMEQECNVDDIKFSLERVLDEPSLSAQMVKDHETTVQGLYATLGKNKKPGKRTHFPDPTELPIEVVELRKELEGVKLTSWKLKTESVMFIRPPRNSDYNSINHVKPAQPGQRALASRADGVVTITVYNKVPWGPSYVSRVCQQAYLSSQTLQEIYETLPCIYSAGKTHNPAGMKPGCAMYIENVLYSDTLDYSNQVSVHLYTASKAGARPVVSHRTMLETRLSSLSLRLNLPYPILHAGNCEHFIVVNQIRLWHSSDPTSGYPQILQITPPLPSLCHACHKIPATLSVAGDVRLGESPSLLCGPCWNTMCCPPDAEEYVVTPLPLSY